MTGYCARGNHDDCKGQVLISMVKLDASVYVPCECSCHNQKGLK